MGFVKVDGRPLRMMNGRQPGTDTIERQLDLKGAAACLGIMNLGLMMAVGPPVTMTSGQRKATQSKVPMDGRSMSLLLTLKTFGKLA